MGRLIPLKVKHNRIYIQLKILLIAIIFLFAVGTVGYSATKQIGFKDSFGLTLETIALSHTSESALGPRIVQVFLLIFGVILFWWIMWTVFDLVLEGKLGELWRDLMNTIQASNLKNHYVICGAGRVGIHIAELLFERKVPFVIIDKDKAIVEVLLKKGMLAINGDALDEEVLREADIEKAKAVVAVIPETERNVMIALMARHLNSNVLIYARSEKEDLVKQLHHAGVKHVVMPEVAGAKEIVSVIAKDEKWLPLTKPADLKSGLPPVVRPGIKSG